MNLPLRQAAAVVCPLVLILTVGLLCSDPLLVLAQEPPPSAQSAEPALPPPGFVAEPAPVKKAVIFLDRHFASGGMTNGWYLDLNNMIPGAGWISGGPGYRRWSRHDRMFLDGSAAISWHGYRTAQARVELPKLAHGRLALGSQFRWQDYTRVHFYGEGPATSDANLSEYGLESTDLVGYATVRPFEWLAIGGEIGWLQPDITARSGPFLRDRPDARQLFPSNIVYGVADQPTFIHSEASIMADRRDFPGHPTRGGLVRATVSQYSDRDLDLFTFRQYETEAAGFVPLGPRVVLAVRGWLVASDTAPGRFVPFYLQPSLGGHNSLRSYAEYRFHDRDMLVINAETRLALMSHVDAAVFVDAGNVAARVEDLNLDRRSYGAGVRLHSQRQTFARVDVARGDEGWRVVFRLTDPLSLARLTRRTAAIPFVP
jgi:Omp85 superfamily domain